MRTQTRVTILEWVASIGIVLLACAYVAAVYFIGPIVLIMSTVALLAFFLGVDTNLLRDLVRNDRAESGDNVER